MGQLARVGVDLWLTAWSTASEQATAAADAGTPSEEFNLELPTAAWVTVAAVLVAVNFAVAFGRSLLCVNLSIRASRALHQRAVDAVLSAPLCVGEPRVAAAMHILKHC